MPRKSHKRKSNKRNMKGGASDWGFSQYSAGPVNSPPQSEAQFRMFNKSTPYSVGSQSVTSADIDSVLCNKPVSGWSRGDSLTSPNSAESYALVGGKKKKAVKRKSAHKKKSATKKRSAHKRKSATKKRSAHKRKSATKKRSAKRKTPKRKSPKRKSAKRKSPKRKSPKRKTPKRKSAKRKTPKRKSAKRKSAKKGGAYTDALTVLGLVGLHDAAKRSPRRKRRTPKKRSTRRRR
jgi:flagellar biosynthesis GTPase FlhF